MAKDASRKTINPDNSEKRLKKSSVGNIIIYNNINKNIKYKNKKLKDSFLSNQGFLTASLKEISDNLILEAYRLYERLLGVKMGVGLRVFSYDYAKLLLQDYSLDDIEKVIRLWKSDLLKENKRPAQYINFKSLIKEMHVYLQEEPEWT